ncbi:MAG: hypothetical protein V4477_16990 [Pseudomonadota bacterium]
MRTASVTTAALSNLGGAEIRTTRTETCTVSALQEAITELVYHFNPKKTWGFVAEAFGLKERAAKHRLANNSSYTIEELQVLFQGEQGLSYLEAMMADATPEWWMWTRQIMAQASKRRLAAEATQEALALEAQLQPTAAARRLTKGNADATKKLNSAFARKETALGFLRPDVDRALDSRVAETKAAPAKRAYAGRGR